jgi:hypothetical protein
MGMNILQYGISLHFLAEHKVSAISQWKKVLENLPDRRKTEVLKNMYESNRSALVMKQHFHNAY